MKKFLSVVAFALIVGVSVTLSAQTKEDHQAIEQSAAEFVKAFNQGDAKVIGQLFTESAEYTTADGTVLKGQKAIAADFASFFEENPDLKIGISVDEIRFLSPNVAVEKGSTWQRVAPVGEPGYSRYTATHSKVNGKWHVASLQESNEELPTHYSHLQHLEWLIGTWQSDFGTSQLETTFEWTANKSFLKRSFKVTQGDEIISSGLQVIGWDASQEQIVSWFFGAEGGHAQGLLTREGDQSRLKITSVLADGAVAEATNIIRKVNDNQFTWESTNRSLNGKPIADAPQVTLTRITNN